MDSDSVLMYGGLGNILEPTSGKAYTVTGGGVRVGEQVFLVVASDLDCIYDVVAVTKTEALANASSKKRPEDKILQVTVNA